MTDCGWGEGHVADLKKWWAEGLSATDIGKRLGISRNSVIGKITRLRDKGDIPARAVDASHIGGRPKNFAPRAPAKPKATAAPRLAPVPEPRAKAAPARRASLPEPEPIRLPDLPENGRVTIMHLSSKTCRWPIGDPGHPDFCFCGHGPRDGSSYCEYHARLAYQPLWVTKKPAAVRWNY